MACQTGLPACLQEQASLAFMLKPQICSVPHVLLVAATIELLPKCCGEMLISISSGDQCPIWMQWHAKYHDSCKRHIGAACI